MSGASHVALSLALLLGSSVALAQTTELADVVEELAADLRTAQEELSRAHATIAEERGRLAQQISAAQNRVLDLREEAVAARRLADEETLTLRQIETRLETWREQSQFQSRLLAGFLDRADVRPVTDVASIELTADLKLLADYLSAQQERLYPDWRSDRIVLPDGQLGEVSLLKLGPVQWFFHEGLSLAGLTESNADVTRVRMPFDASARAGIESLHRASVGVVTFDPTLSRALMLAEDDETLLEHLQKGGIWVIPILLFALFATVTAIVKAVHLYRLPALLPALAERVESALKGPAETFDALVAKVAGPQAELLAIALAEQSAEQRDERLYAALLAQRNGLERWLGAIATTASVAPLLGLLGTVSGMITTFNLMTLFGAGDANSVSAGISEALVTTELGLVVAIPALIAHALMSRKVKNYFAQLENDAVHLSQLPARSG